MQQHTNHIENYIITEKGDLKAQEMLNPLLMALVAFEDILISKSGRKFNIALDNFEIEAATHGIYKVASAWNFSTRNEEELKKIAYREVEKALITANEAAKLKSEFDSDRRMLITILDGIKGAFGKEVNFEDALRIFVFLKVEALSLGKMTQEKHFLKSSLRQQPIDAVQH